LRRLHERIGTVLHLLRTGGIRRYLDTTIPAFHRVLLIESGSRHLIEHLLLGLYQHHPEIELVDVVTCYPGQPLNLDTAKGTVYRTTDWLGRERRRYLYQVLRDRNYSVVGMICSGEPIMTRWKWALWWQVPGKYFLLNENGDYVWFDRSQWKVLRHFALFRIGLSGPDAWTTIGNLLLFPAAVLYLLVYAGAVHMRRRLRT
jgi:hypothetical protein